ncbi:MAG: peroxiredoxin family protein [Fidelibacterota bacterium]
MKRWLIFFSLFHIGLFSQTTQVAPNVTLTLLDGKKVQLKDIASQGPVVVDFWATWCEPCKKEMVQLEKIYKKYKEQGLTILAISQDSPRSLAKVKPYIRSKRFTYQVARDPNQQVGKKFNVQLLPTTFIVNSGMEIVWTHQGYIPGDEKKLETIILGLLGDE